MNKKKQRRKLKRKTRGNSYTRSGMTTNGVQAEDRYKSFERKLFSFDTNAGLIPIKVQNALHQMRDVR